MDGVTAIIPNWNGRVLLARLLASLGRQRVPFAEILVVDNGSEDGSEAEAAARGARVLRMGANAGFSRAVNRGVEAASSRWVAVLNNDVVLAEDWLERMLEAARDPDVWFLTGKLLAERERRVVDGTFDVLCRGGCAWRMGHHRPDGADWSHPQRIAFAPLTAALLRRELFARVGGLDETFETFMEDVEFGLRCALAGYPGLYVPAAVAHHAGGATHGGWHPERVRRIARNQLLLVAKHYPPSYLRRSAWAVFVAQLLWGLLAFRHGAGRAYLRGKWEALRRFGSLRAQAARTDERRLRQVLEDSERRLRAAQQRTGPDWYWRLYFALT
ncbi:MAG: glycosyltransferase family 2 protein [Bryobacteraceae bacterium]|nr:glycosyltransferase family 2 protein [Bryobacteraceae bacterium]